MSRCVCGGGLLTQTGAPSHPSPFFRTLIIRSSSQALSSSSSFSSSSSSSTQMCHLSSQHLPIIISARLELEVYLTIISSRLELNVPINLSLKCVLIIISSSSRSGPLIRLINSHPSQPIPIVSHDMYSTFHVPLLYVI